MDPGERMHPTATFAVLVTAATAYSLLQSLVVPALPTIQRDLHTSPSGASWILTSLLLSAAVATPIVGRLGDMYGKQRLLLIVLATLSVGTLIAALASSMLPLLVGRVLQGVGAGVFPLGFAIIRDEFPRERVAGAVGLLSALLGIGGGAGVVLAGPITDNLSYHYLFWFPLIVIVIATIAVAVIVPESPIKVPSSVNWLSALLISAGLGLVLLGVSEAPSWRWLSARTLGSIAAGLVVLALWVANELRARQPLIDMRIMAIRGVWTTNLVAFMLGFGMYASFVLIPELVQTPASAGVGFGSSVTQAGLFLLPSTATMLLTGLQTGRLEARFGSKPLLLGGIAFSFVSFLMLAVTHARPYEIYVASGIFGIGIGLAFAAMANLIIENVRPEVTGAATGVNYVARTIGGAFGAAATASIIASTVGRRLYPTSHGYTAAFAVCAGILGLAVLAGLTVPPRQPRDAFVGTEPS